AVLLDGGQERVAVRDGGDDVEAAVPQESLEPVAQEREVLGDHHPHGSTALITVGPPAGLLTSSEPSSASTRWAPWRSVTQIVARVAPLCLAVFASASETTNQAAVSTCAGGRRGSSK